RSLISLSTSICILYLLLFFFNATPTPAIYTLSLHDALPISSRGPRTCRHPPENDRGHADEPRAPGHDEGRPNPQRLGDRAEALGDRKSTRLNSSHVAISYAVFCLKKKKRRLSPGRSL